MNEQPERVEQFQAEINSMKVKASGAENESRLLILGIVLAVAGLALAIVGGVQVGGAADALDQQSFLATGSFLGIALIIAGAALFVRYSLARYLRFWLVRLVYESRANTDRIVEAIDRAAHGPE
ncbi:MAG: hypothetical protein V9E99_01080 [Microthrixaceae bacterium]|jgi:uncharacterized membrane protein YidH (DUF202 family)|nr:hypothetical protein [Actinomycetota bacterium]MBP6728431.1 hypothetical protein [Microthrixaceae bacterium]HMS13057.1 hypothetical protein [Microthrixaceae bacterium]HMT25190.1 hypothetical protein [Microthrixaceae bacterium]HMT60189.1 hypothetical protein [Microthrixaceae bacterium]